ncbi:MAG: Transcriptional regulator of nonfermentable carbon utilization [Watsoniomyces obsoletus]|nr:MAG: Transcriptional regulator of nonfermentable carbon utilization [Watsoniomyces obsoletus]
MPDEVDQVYTSSDSEGNGEVKEQEMDVDMEQEPEQEHEHEQEHEQDMASQMGQSTSSGGGDALPKRNGASNSAKDPLRPKRKKARRACHACQRAHLTCGDERPCERCIKRGLQNSCHDGTRKKAKYLLDTPPEAVMAGRRLGQQQQQQQRSGPLTSPPPINETGDSGLNNNNPQPSFYRLDPAISPQAYDAFTSTGMHPPMAVVPPSLNLANHQSPTSANFGSVGSQQSTPLPMYPGVMPAQASPVSQAPQSTPNVMSGSLFDPNDPSAYNFDLASLNFGNHYGALEFGMLGHMSSGAMMSPPLDQSGGIGQSGAELGSTTSMVTSPTFPPSSTEYLFNNDTVMADWSGDARADNTFGDAGERPPTGVAHGYTIGTGMAGMPGTGDASQGLYGIYGGGGGGVMNSDLSQQQQQQQQTYMDGISSGSMGRPSTRRPTSTTNGSAADGSMVAHNGAPQNASSIYDSVTEPYSYTAGFHAMTAFLQRRFPTHKTNRIAKALASIRPSFISCTKTLTQEDLVFMEKCFQRTLWEYENFIDACATPTIVCRRTGEVAAVGNEFSILTGWRAGVLLGKEPNMNVNIGPGSTSTSMSGGSAPSGYTTPRKPDAAKSNGNNNGNTNGNGTGNGNGNNGNGNNRPQPVFLAELLDDDSVIKFYEDFAKLAFGDSRGSVMTKCKLLKYKTKEDIEGGGGGVIPPNGSSRSSMSSSSGSGSSSDGNGMATSRRPSTVISGGGGRGNQSRGNTNVNVNAEGGGGGTTKTASSFDQLESEDGTVECICCWTVRRDVFDMPMMIVMNVSIYSFPPCLANQDIYLDKDG